MKKIESHRISFVFLFLIMLLSTSGTLPAQTQKDLYNVKLDNLTLKEAMVKICQNEDIRTSLIQKGFEQKENFSWDKTAELVWKSIQSCIQTEANNKGK